MGCALFASAPPFIINLGGGDVVVAKELLGLAEIDAGIQTQSGGGRPQGMRPVEPFPFPLLSPPLGSFSA